MHIITFIKPDKHLKKNEETAYLLSTKANAKHLRKSIRSIKIGNLFEKELLPQLTNK